MGGRFSKTPPLYQEPHGNIQRKASVFLFFLYLQGAGLLEPLQHLLKKRILISEHREIIYCKPPIHMKADHDALAVDQQDFIASPHRQLTLDGHLVCWSGKDIVKRKGLPHKFNTALEVTGVTDQTIIVSETWKLSFFRIGHPESCVSIGARRYRSRLRSWFHLATDKIHQKAAYKLWLAGFLFLVKAKVTEDVAIDGKVDPAHHLAISRFHIDARSATGGHSQVYQGCTRCRGYSRRLIFGGIASPGTAGRLDCQNQKYCKMSQHALVPFFDQRKDLSVYLIDLGLCFCLVTLHLKDDLTDVEQ